MYSMLDVGHHADSLWIHGKVVKANLFVVGSVFCWKQVIFPAVNGILLATRLPGKV